MTECHHQITDAPVRICRLRSVNPSVRHGGRYQYDVIVHEGLQGVAGHPVAVSLHDAVQFPCVVPVQFGLEGRLYPLVDEEERMVLRFGQFVRYYSVVHGYEKCCADANIRQK